MRIARNEVERARFHMESYDSMPDTQSSIAVQNLLEGCLTVFSEENVLHGISQALRYHVSQRRSCCPPVGSPAERTLDQIEILAAVTQDVRDVARGKIEVPVVRLAPRDVDGRVIDPQKAADAAIADAAFNGPRPAEPDPGLVRCDDCGVGVGRDSPEVRKWHRALVAHKKPNVMYTESYCPACAVKHGKVFRHDPE